MKRDDLGEASEVKREQNLRPANESSAKVWARTATIARLNWGCGDWVEPGWVNSDVKVGQGVVAADIRSGLPFDDETFEYAVGIHALPELHLNDLVSALRELHRVLQPGGVLRLGLPDLDRAIRAYVAGDREYFLIPDDEEATLGGKLIQQLLWYGYSRSLFTFDFVADLMRKAGFQRVERCAFRETSSTFPEIVSLDNRERESLFVEGHRRSVGETARGEV